MTARASEGSEKMHYLETEASRERIGEIRRQVEHNRLEARLAKARLSYEAVLQEPRPYASVFTRPRLADGTVAGSWLVRDRVL